MSSSKSKQINKKRKKKTYPSHGVWSGKTRVGSNWRTWVLKLPWINKRSKHLWDFIAARETLSLCSSWRSSPSPFFSCMLTQISSVNFYFGGWEEACWERLTPGYCFVSKPIYIIQQNSTKTVSGVKLRQQSSVSSLRNWQLFSNKNIDFRKI